VPVNPFQSWQNVSLLSENNFRISTNNTVTPIRPMDTRFNGVNLPKPKSTLCASIWAITTIIAVMALTQKAAYFSDRRLFFYRTILVTRAPTLMK
jgi:hypothetical protein